jgi:hypothetical protein
MWRAAGKRTPRAPRHRGERIEILVDASEASPTTYARAVPWVRARASTGWAVVALLVVVGCSSCLGPAVKPPSEPEPGEVARFWFNRPGHNKVSVGPYAVTSDALVIRGACRSATGELTWKIFDNSVDPDTADDVVILDEGEIACDGSEFVVLAQVGAAAREVGILGMTGTEKGSDWDESVWLTLANQ